MKKGLTIAFFFICSWASGTTYYVATNGKDSNPGSFSQPWGTWGKAFTSTSVKAGDTIFIRGGVYNITVNNGSGYRVTRAGTADNLIVYSNFPGEIPILDCSNVQTTTQYPVAVQASTSDGANYVKFIGLTVRNHPQYRKDVMTWVKGFGCENGFFTFENCTAYNIEGHGFDSYFYNGYPIVNGAHTFINCDAYVCYNPEVISGYLPGNAGVGFNSQNWYGTEGHAYAINCRAWECGDQGFSWNGEHYCEAVGCWSFNNGKLQGDGHGFKLGWHDREYPAAGRLNVVNKNCIAAYNRASGMTTNDSGEGIATGMNIYNNLIYHNGYSDHPSWRYQYGLYVYNTPDDDSDELLRIFRNNICFDNAYGEVYVASGAYYTHSHNSWDGGATITAADFKALPESQVAGISLLSSPRNQDGSLPDLGDYFQLADNSDAIDAGLNVGIPFAGEAPDLGFLETKVAADTPLIPTLIKAVIENANPSQLVMTYSLPLANTVPANSAFTVRVNSTARSLNAVAISGTTVTLTLASPVNYGDQVTVAYTKPSINPIQTPQGAQAASFAAQTVNNNVAATSPVYVRSSVENANPSQLVMTYSLPLAN
ncbi:MAG TPA: SwmB domain-containing protein, partial [Bacteroidales bacterium]|nr:SwmB domain-containing protein [Bacteroidales bacterium]